MTKAKAKEKKERAKEHLRVLRAARALVAKPDGWTQHVSARSRRGREVSVLRRAAASFCVIGACERAAWTTDPDHYYRLPYDALDALLRTISAPGRKCYAVGAWNDQPRRTQKQVVALFDKTIRRLVARAV